jgi:hypothetical protein
MECVWLATHRSVHATVRRRHHENAVVAEHPCDLIQHSLLLHHVLDDLECDHSIERPVLVRTKVHCRPELELQVRRRIVQATVLDRLLVDIHPHDVRGRLRQQRRAKSLPAA